MPGSRCWRRSLPLVPRHVRQQVLEDVEHILQRFDGHTLVGSSYGMWHLLPFGKQTKVVGIPFDEHAGHQQAGIQVGFHIAEDSKAWCVEWFASTTLLSTLHSLGVARGKTAERHRDSPPNRSARGRHAFAQTCSSSIWALLCVICDPRAHGGHTSRSLAFLSVSELRIEDVRRRKVSAGDMLPPFRAARHCQWRHANIPEASLQRRPVQCRWEGPLSAVHERHDLRQRHSD